MALLPETTKSAKNAKIPPGRKIREISPPRPGGPAGGPAGGPPGGGSRGGSQTGVYRETPLFAKIVKIAKKTVS